MVNKVPVAVKDKVFYRKHEWVVVQVEGSRATLYRQAGRIKNSGINNVDNTNPVRHSHRVITAFTNMLVNKKTLQN